MGSLRNPIGPLPSSIYWRRRAVVLVVLVLLVLVVFWAVTSLGGDSSRNEGKSGDKGNGPAGTITPGPADSGPAISERPGGRDEEDGGSDGSGSGSASGSGGSGGSEDSDAADQSSAGGTGWGAGNGSSTGGSGSGTGGPGGGAAGVPAPPSLADCRQGEVQLKLRSLRKEYGPGEKPRFQLKVTNERNSPCKIDLGRTATVVTINNPDEAKFWASDDCPPTKKPLPRLVPGNGTSTHTLTWFRKASAANCGTPTFEAPKPGTYEIEVKVKGLKTVRTTFELVK